MSNPPFGELTASAQQSAADASSAYDQQSHQRNERGQFAPGNASGMATRFQPGNTLSLRHGLRSDRAAAGMLPNQSDLHASQRQT